MPQDTKKNHPFSVFTAAQNIKKTAVDRAKALGESPSPSYTEKKKTPPRHNDGPNMSWSKAGSMLKTGADIIGLDGKLGFQNSFGSIKGMGKMGSKKSKK